jgi:predicted aspartyl protease
VTDHPKSLFASQRNPTNIHTGEAPKLNYIVEEYLKKMKCNVSVMDMCKIPLQKYFLLQDLKLIDTPITRTDQSDVLSPTNLTNKPSVNACSLENIGIPFFPPFLLTFDVFNRNLHNFLVDSGASSNVIPLSIYKKLNMTPLKSDKHVIQLDRTQVKVIAELKHVMIKIATQPKFVQVIDIIVVDITEAYGMLLSRDWSEKLNGYFSSG